MASMGKIVVTIENGASFLALKEGIELVRLITEEQPWNEEAKQALRKLKRACRGLRATPIPKAPETSE